MPQPSPDHPVAYFCTEYAISQDLPIYSGGLGVLAGDLVKQANDQNFPLVAVGLFYHQGYFIQRIHDGLQMADYHTIDPEKAGLQLVTTHEQQPLLIIVPHQSSYIQAQVWHYHVGHISLYLLDTDIPGNPAEYRAITRRLYDAGTDTRILQEIVLGIGGVKMLHALSITPSIFHLNEGHSAFAAFEILAEILHHQDSSLIEALDSVASQMVFTNHTIVPAGNDVFYKTQLEEHLTSYAEAESLPLAELLELGTAPTDPQRFSMATLALTTAGQSNTVSQLHYQMARSVWPQYTFHSVTNGVHLPTWIAKSTQQAAGQLTIDGLNRITDNQLWQLHLDNKNALLQLVAEQCQVQLHPQALTLVWARRFATYKRADLVLSDIDLLRELTDEQQIQIIFAGKAHPNDAKGQEIIASINRQIQLRGLTDSVVFIPNYNLPIAQTIVAGADIWLNTPIRGQEASGTSGMKAGANGALHLSISDGWMDEVNWQDCGWILPIEHTDTAIYARLQEDILPLYQQRSDQNLPDEWIRRMRQTMAISWTQFSAGRMLKEYQEQLYTGPNDQP